MNAEPALRGRPGRPARIRIVGGAAAAGAAFAAQLRGTNVEVDLAAAPVAVDDAPRRDPVASAAAWEGRLGIPAGLWAQAEPAYAARYAPGLAPSRGTLAPQRLAADFAAACAAADAEVNAGADIVLDFLGGSPLLAAAAALRGVAYRVVERVSEAGVAYWAQDPAGALPPAIAACPSPGADAIAARLADAEPAPAAADERHGRVRGARYEPGGFADDLGPDPTTILFPLQAEPSPEMARQSPYLLNQHVAIVALCRDLPAGARLAIAEHPSMIGRRPPNFYRQLRDLRMATLLPLGSSIRSALDRSAALAAIGGGVARWAALRGTPVINFAPRFAWRHLANVHTVGDLGDTGPAIRAALAPHDGAALRRAACAALAAVAYAADGDAARALVAGIAA
jgi:hypothetical protein